MALVTRRGFAGFWPAAVIGGEFALARAARGAGEPMVAIDSNENPDGPPEIALKVMRESLALGGRYHGEATEDLETELGRALGLKPGEVLAGAGSSEILHAAIDVFTSATRPVVVSNPTYEACPELARALGRPSEKVPLTPTYAADVEKMAAVARVKKAGLVYLCNPNNPTGSATPQDRIKWLSENLPADCVLLVDEAYLDFSPQLGSAVGLIKAGRNVVVARTFSKIWGMAGLRVGYGCARTEYINKMAPFRDMVVNMASARGALAAVKNSGTILPQRRAKMTKLRGDVCAWLHGKGFDYIEPYGNFVMIKIKKPVRPVIQAFASKGVAVGRPFPPYEDMLRVTIGTEHEMDRFRAAFTQVFS
ncbi:MAG: aminotransferase class I/II-fold pyridoxal phosphate-dependent enzyme [Bryobacteraceae bacterium]